MRRHSSCVRYLGTLVLALNLAGCAVTCTTPVFDRTQDQLTRTLRYCDPDSGWEIVAPAAGDSTGAYELPKTQLVVLQCDVRDPERFFQRAAREFEHFLLDQGAMEVRFRREGRGDRQDLSWKYESGGREGLVTLWATPADDRIRELYVTLHESRKAR